MSLTVGVVGCGNISNFHFPGLEQAGANIKWVCDLSEDAARPWAIRHDATYTDDFHDVIADPEIDVLDVTAISSTHKQICLEAIAKGKAVICEKTLAENADDSLAIVSAAKSAGTVFYTSYMKRFIPAVQKAKDLMPGIGRIISTHIRAYQPWGDLWNENPPSGFLHTPSEGKSVVRKNYGGGILVCGGSHILDLIGFFLGRPGWVCSDMYTPEDRDYDLQASALLHTENGAVHLDALAHPLKKIGFLDDGWDEKIEIIGTEGKLDVLSAKWDQPDFKASKCVHYDNKTGARREYLFEPVSPFVRAIEFYLRNIAKGQQGEQPITTGYDVDELISSIEKSSHENSIITVNFRI